MWTGILLVLAVLVVAASAAMAATAELAAWPMAGLLIALSVFAASIGWRFLRVLDVLHVEPIASYKAIGGATVRKHRFEVVCLICAFLGVLTLMLLAARSLYGGAVANGSPSSINVDVQSSASTSGGGAQWR